MQTIIKYKGPHTFAELRQLPFAQHPALVAIARQISGQEQAARRAVRALFKKAA